MDAVDALLDPSAEWLSAEDLGVAAPPPPSSLPALGAWPEADDALELPVLYASSPPPPHSQSALPSRPPSPRCFEPSVACSGASSGSVGHATSSASSTAGDSDLGALLSPTEEARRAKNRDKVRRMYYRKKSTLQRLRDLAEQLEGHVQWLTHGGVKHQYARLLAGTEARARSLEHERERLMATYRLKVAAMERVRDLLKAEEALFSSTELAKSEFFVSFSRAECHATRDRAVATVLALMPKLVQSKKRRQGLDIMGWEAGTTVKGEIFSFSLYKTFRSTSVDATAQRSYSMMTNETTISRFYSAASDAKHVVVQRVDDDNAVIFQQFDASDGDGQLRHFKTLYLVSRVPTSTGVLTVMLGLGLDRIRCPDLFLPTSDTVARRIAERAFLGSVYYVSLDRTGDDCAMSFGGMIPLLMSNSAAVWGMTLVHMAHKWECAVLGPPPVLLPSTQA